MSFNEATMPQQQRVNATDYLVQPKSQFYGIDIPVPHPQLRQLFSTTDQDWLYVASGFEIYSIHMPSQRKTLLEVLSFIPRCLTAGLGWICVGGESDGKAIVIQLEDVDERQFRTDASSKGRAASDVRRKPEDLILPPKVVELELGGEIVNSVTIHELSNAGRSRYNEPLALFSNNDKTVKIYSLLRQQVLCDLTHPFPINCALISPNSEILVTVGDSDRAFIYGRRPLTSTEDLSRKKYADYEWEQVLQLKLSCGERLHDDHSFAVAFSPSGQLCAISAQGGMISVFEFRYTFDGSGEVPCSVQPSLLCSFNSSMAGIPGSVRSMRFSPAPLDLLAWSEDHGHGGIVDVRGAFSRRQLLRLDANASHVERVALGQTTVSSNSSSDPASSQPPTQTNSTDADAREQSILDSLQVTLDEVEQSNSGPHPYSLDYSSSLRPDDPSHTRTNRHVREQFDALFRRIRDTGSPAQVEALVDMYRGHNPYPPSQETDRQHRPRRRNSVVLSQSSNQSTRGTSTLAPISGLRARMSASPARMDEGETEPTSADPSQTNLSYSRSTTHDTDLQHEPRVSPLPSMRQIIESRSQYQTGSEDPSSPLTGSLSSTVRGRLGNWSAGDGSILGSVSRTEASDSDRVEPIAAPVDSHLWMLTQQDRARAALSGAARVEALRDPRYRPPVATAEEIRRRALSLSLEARRQQIELASAQALSASRELASQRSEDAHLATQEENAGFARQVGMLRAARYAIDRNGNWLGQHNTDQAGNRFGTAGRMNLGDLGVGTTGTGWSPDGRHLYFGTLEGIFEFIVNMDDRRFSPAASFR